MPEDIYNSHSILRDQYTSNFAGPRQESVRRNLISYENRVNFKTICEKHLQKQFMANLKNFFSKSKKKLAPL
ncbi:hypothetical protein L3V82_00630 [Thiotrichales bacterium 19S3-7]|nr:hypothetical protein [Thiotrichales bacterium 19S3-7]MCF6800668.1 hypothetical protein [Thiotrichales bacterium 19S3-11]